MLGGRRCKVTARPQEVLEFTPRATRNWSDNHRNPRNETVLRTGEEYIESLRDGREVWIDGERVSDVPAHPAFAPMVNLRAGVYDLGHEAGARDLLTYADEQSGERCAITSRPPRTRDDCRRSCMSPGTYAAARPA